MSESRDDPDAPDERGGRVLIIGGSDSSGGAGIQADIKTVTMLGGYAASAITAITVQDTLGVHQILPLTAGLITAQARAVLEDIGADAIKTGMLADRAAILAVAELIESSSAPAVIDPVLMAKGGAKLASSDALELMRERLAPLARLLTPNAPEAEALTGLRVASTDDARRAADLLLRAGAGAVLLKGGHIPGETVVDLLATPEGETLFEAARVDTRHTHGTGCTLASGCATGLALGLPLALSVANAWAYVGEAIRQAPGLGRGHGPLGHGWPLRR